MKRTRHSAILDIVRQREIRSQAELVEALAEVGIQANQATVSRDLRELGLARLADQRYAAPTRPEGQALGRLFELYVRQLDGNADLLMLKTEPGAAHIVAAAIDAQRDPEVVGTLAGDDTLIVMPRTREARRALENRWRALMGGAHLQANEEV